MKFTKTGYLWQKLVLPYLHVYKSTFYELKIDPKIALDLHMSHTQRADQIVSELLLNQHDNCLKSTKSVKIAFVFCQQARYFFKFEKIKLKWLKYFLQGNFREKYHTGCFLEKHYCKTYKPTYNYSETLLNFLADEVNNLLICINYFSDN